jgi:hypothetical protein
MKSAKKMIMIPEVEYFALLSMLKSDDPMKSEKALIDAKMHQNLQDKHVSEDVKAKKYDWLLKQKRKLRELIEGKPQKVVIENMPVIPNIPPYMGIKEEGKKVKLKRKIARSNIGSLVNSSRKGSEFTSHDSASDLTSDDYVSPLQQTSAQAARNAYPLRSQPSIIAPTQTPSSAGSITPRQETPKSRSSASISPQIHGSKYNQVMAYVTKNKEKYGIMGDGSILTNFKKPVGGSNYVDSIKYLTGQISTPPKGLAFLKAKLMKDDEFKTKFLQTGKGKINKKLIVIKMKPIKTPGLNRSKHNIFKPKLWAKL